MVRIEMRGGIQPINLTSLASMTATAPVTDCPAFTCVATTSITQYKALSHTKFGHQDPAESSRKGKNLVLPRNDTKPR